MEQSQQEEAYLTRSNQTSPPCLRTSAARVSSTGSLCDVKSFANVLRQKQKGLEFTHAHKSNKAFKSYQRFPTHLSRGLFWVWFKLLVKVWVIS